MVLTATCTGQVLEWQESLIWLRFALLRSIMPVLELDNVARLPIRALITLALKDNLMAIGRVVGDIEHEVHCVCSRTS